MFTSQRFFLQLFITIVALVGCGREKPQSSSAYPTCECDCEEVEKKLAAAELKVAQAKGLIDAAKAGEDPRECTLEYAKSKDKAALESILADQKESQSKLDDLAAEQVDLFNESTRLADFMAGGDFPAAPTADFDFNVYTSDMKAFYSQEDHLCHLRNGKGAQLHAGLHFYTWNFFLIRARKNLDQKEYEASPDKQAEYSDYGVTTRTIRLINEDSGKAREYSEGLMEYLVKNPLATKVAAKVGMTFLSAEQKDFWRVRILRLYTASTVNFRKLTADFEVAKVKYMEKDLSADENMWERYAPAEFQFGITAPDGGYYKGLILRQWRVEEGKGKGRGDLFVRDLKVVLRNVMQGSGINLK